MGSEFKSKYTGTEIDNILDNALNGGGGIRHIRIF